MFSYKFRIKKYLRLILILLFYRANGASQFPNKSYWTFGSFCFKTKWTERIFTNATS